MRIAAIRRRTCAALAMLVAVAGCTRANYRTLSDARLVIAVPVEPNSLDPLFMTGSSEAMIGSLVYSSLVTVDDRGRLRPDVASAIPTQQNGGISRDGLTITYRLRPRVTWQDGAPLTAADIVFTYDAIVNPANNVPSRSGYDEISTVEAVNEHTVRVRLRRPYAPILSFFMAPDQNFEILPRHLLVRYHDLNSVPFNEAPIGSGPFRVVTWRHGDRVRLVRNDTYFAGKPAIEAIDLRFTPNAATILDQLRAHEVDASFLADPTYLPQYAGLSSARVARTPLNGFGDLLFNTQRPEAGDARVRRALASAIDVPRLVRNATRGAQNASGANRALFSWAYDRAFGPPSYDLRAASVLFGRAGWTRGPDGILRKHGRPLSLELAFPSGSNSTAAIAVDLQQELRGAGVSLTLRPYTPSLFRAPASVGGPLYGGRFDLAFLEAFGASDPDTQWYLGCDEMPPDGFNLQRFCDPVLDTAQAIGARSYDRATRRRAVARVQQRVALAVPFVVLYQIDAVNVIPLRLRGFSSSSLSPFWNVAGWKLEP